MISSTPPTNSDTCVEMWEGSLGFWTGTESVTVVAVIPLLTARAMTVCTMLR